MASFEQNIFYIGQGVDHYDDTIQMLSVAKREVIHVLAIYFPVAAGLWHRHRNDLGADRVSFRTLFPKLKRLLVLLPKSSAPGVEQSWGVTVARHRATFTIPWLRQVTQGTGIEVTCVNSLGETGGYEVDETFAARGRDIKVT